MDDALRSEDMSKVLEKLMADEKFGEILSAVKSTMSENPDSANNSSAPVSVETEENSEDKAPVSAIPQLSPELLAKLPDIMTMLSGSSIIKGGGKGPDKGGDTRIADRKRLLQAMKPFLSDRRREAVDSIVNIAGIADLFGI